MAGGYVKLGVVLCVVFPCCVTGVFECPAGVLREDGLCDGENHDDGDVLSSIHTMSASSQMYRERIPTYHNHEYILSRQKRETNNGKIKIVFGQQLK